MKMTRMIMVMIGKTTTGSVMRIMIRIMMIMMMMIKMIRVRMVINRMLAVKT